jgi:hypothetical protein
VGVMSGQAASMNISTLRVRLIGPGVLAALCAWSAPTASLAAAPAPGVQAGVRAVVRSFYDDMGTLHGKAACDQLTPAFARWLTRMNHQRTCESSLPGYWEVRTETPAQRMREVAAVNNLIARSRVTGDATKAYCQIPNSTKNTGFPLITLSYEHGRWLISALSAEITA